MILEHRPIVVQHCKRRVAVNKESVRHTRVVAVVAKRSDEKRKSLDLCQGCTQTAHPESHVHVTPVKDMRAVVEVVVRVGVVVSRDIVQEIGHHFGFDFEKVDHATEPRGGSSQIESRVFVIVVREVC